MKKVNLYFAVIGTFLLLINVWTLGQAAASQPTLAQIKQKTVPVIRQHAAEVFSANNAVVRGNPQGKITLVEFYDYQCEHCRDTAPVIDQLIKDNSQLRVVFRELPILGYYSRQAALAALAAYDVDNSKFMAFHNILMKAPVPFNSSTIKISAQAAGYNYDQLKQAISSGQYQSIIANNFDLAQSLLKPALGYIATPILIIAPTDITANKNQAPIEFILGQATATQLQQAIDVAEKS